MSVRFVASTDKLARTTALPASTLITLCGWGVIRGEGGSTHSIFTVFTDLATGQAILSKVFGSNNIRVLSVGGGPTVLGTPATDEWFFWALTQNGSGAGALTGYLGLGGSALASGAITGDSFTTTEMDLAYASATGFLNGAIAAVKVWDAVLTATELEQERWTYRPLRLANLHLWSPFVDIDTTNFRDYSGAGKDWTESGTVTNEDGPPIAWGPRGHRWSIRRRRAFYVNARRPAVFTPGLAR